MPIDLALLRWESTRKEVEQWQELRNNNESIVSLVCVAEKEYRETKKQLALARQEYKDNKTKTRRSHVHTLEQSVQERQDELYHVLLPKLGNMIDDVEYKIPPSSLPDDDNDIILGQLLTSSSNTLTCYYALGKDDEIMIRKNPLYSIGGCEIILQSHKNKKKSKMVLNRWGKEMIQAMEEYRDKMIPSHQSIHLSEYTLLSKYMAHALLGCCNNNNNNNNNNNCNICSSKDEDDWIPVPSWISFQPPQYPTFSESQLPYICFCPCNTNDFDEEYGHALETLHICAFTSPTLLESRHMQDTLVHQIITYYSSLLLPSSSKQQDENSTTIIRIRTRPKEELEWYEARHITIEGYMPSQKKYIPLGYVSNTTDYMTRVHSLQFIGGGQKKQDKSFVHFIHAKLVPSSIVLSWLFEHNITQHVAATPNIDNNKKKDKQVTKQQIGILFPPCLNDYKMRTIHLNNEPKKNSLLFFPYQRFWKHGSKKGKVIFQQIHPIPMPYSISIQSNNDNHDAVDDDDDDDDGSKRENVNSCTIVGPKFPPLSNIPLDKDNDILLIRGEALCSPHDFLPFHYL